MKHPPRSVERFSCFALGCSPSGRPVGLTRSLPRPGRPFPAGMDIPPRSLRSLPPRGLVSRSGRPFPIDLARIELAPEVGDDLERIFDYLSRHDVGNAPARIREIIQAISVL